MNANRAYLESIYALPIRSLIPGNVEFSSMRVRCCNCGRFRNGSFTQCKYCGYRDSAMSCSVKMSKPAENIEIAFTMSKEGDIDKDSIYAGPVRPSTNPVDAAVNVLSRRQHNESTI